jgi:transposase-like protein
MGKHRTYTAEERQAALETLVTLDGNCHAASRETGIERTTLVRWAKEMAAVNAGIALALFNPAHAKALQERWERLQHLTIDHAEAALTDTEHPPRLHDLAAIGRVAHDAFFDHKHGRKGMQIDVDARTVVINPLTKLSLDELRALAAGDGDKA